MPEMFRRWSSPVLGAVAIAVVTASAVPRAGQRESVASVTLLATTLEKAADRVEDFFERAQSLVCTETVHVQPLSHGLSGEGFGRTVESELRLSWTPGDDGAAATEAQAMRQVMRVNGHVPKKNDRNNCTTPERHDTETQVLSMLLDSQRDDYTWRIAGVGKIDNRAAVLLDFSEKQRLSLDVTIDDDDDDCMTYTIKGGTRGRLWIDAESYDVLRLDQRLSGQAEAPLPKKLLRRAGSSTRLLVERFETSYRFRRLEFDEPRETVVLPVSATSLRILQGGGTPRSRITTEYRKYRRFLTAGRLVPDESR